jgi:hypothetical protein
MAKSPTRRLSELESMRHCYGGNCGKRVEALLTGLQHVRFRDPERLIRFHDTLLFLRAFPHSKRVVELTERLLAGFAAEILHLRKRGADMDVFDPEEVSGIAGTELNYTFTFEVAEWLLRRHGADVRAEWDFEEQAPRLAAILPRFIPLFEDDALVEADTPLETWMRAAAGEESLFTWLMRCFERAATPIPEKAELYDSLGIDLHWELGSSSASRTLARRKVSQFFFHGSPLIQRRDVSLAAELSSPRLPFAKMTRQAAEEILDMCRDALTVRYRELYGTTRGDPEQCFQADLGRGVQVFLWGLPPDRRLPLRAYHAGFTLKNGVPINYIEGISLFEWMEVGFNTFYTYRDGETAWIYSKVIHLLHQLAGVTCISVYPYQLGHDNEEAIKSGAFWFYRKLGFRPGRPELLALTKREEDKIRRSPAHRTSAPVLRKLAAGHVFYEFGPRPQGEWDKFSIRNIGFAVQRRMAKEFGGDAAQMRGSATSDTIKLLGINLDSWHPLERAALKNFAMVLSLIPEVRKWSTAERAGLANVIRAKAAPDESEYLRLMQQHEKFRAAIIRLGSAE